MIFFILKELKRADLQESIIVSLDDNQCQCRKKKKRTAQVWRSKVYCTRVTCFYPDMNLHKSPTNSNCQNFASRARLSPLHACKKQGQKTQAKQPTPHRLIYRHQTGKAFATSCDFVVLSNKSLSKSLSQKEMGHPETTSMYS